MAVFNSGWKMRDSRGGIFAAGKPLVPLQDGAASLVIDNSGLGTDSSGNLIYVAGDQLTLSGLADTMTTAGVQRGTELDIHPRTVTFTIIRPTRSGIGLDATNLLPAMVKPADRCLTPDHRDFPRGHPAHRSLRGTP